MALGIYKKKNLAKKALDVIAIGIIIFKHFPCKSLRRENRLLYRYTWLNTHTVSYQNINT